MDSHKFGMDLSRYCVSSQVANGFAHDVTCVTAMSTVNAHRFTVFRWWFSDVISIAYLDGSDPIVMRHLAWLAVRIATAYFVCILIFFFSRISPCTNLTELMMAAVRAGYYYYFCGERYFWNFAHDRQPGWLAAVEIQHSRVNGNCCLLTQRYCQTSTQFINNIEHEMSSKTVGKDRSWIYFPYLTVFSPLVGEKSGAKISRWEREAPPFEIFTHFNIDFTWYALFTLVNQLCHRQQWCWCPKIVLNYITREPFGLFASF